MAKNVLGGDLKSCCTDPMTGYFRDGFCRTDATDTGRHIVCAKVTDEFLAYSKSQGNDLITPVPEYRFPGLKAGDRWCVCVLRWKEALDEGVAPPLYLGSTHVNVLKHVHLEDLMPHALDLAGENL